MAFYKLVTKIKWQPKGHRIFVSDRRHILLSVLKKFDGDIIASFWDTAQQRMVIRGKNKTRSLFTGKLQKEASPPSLISPWSEQLFAIICEILGFFIITSSFLKAPWCKKKK